jgi:hypothetical protein
MSNRLINCNLVSSKIRKIMFEWNFSISREKSESKELKLENKFDKLDKFYLKRLPAKHTSNMRLDWSRIVIPFAEWRSISNRWDLTPAINRNFDSPQLHELFNLRVKEPNNSSRALDELRALSLGGISHLLWINSELFCRDDGLWMLLLSFCSLNHGHRNIQWSFSEL